MRCVATCVAASHVDATRALACRWGACCDDFMLLHRTIAVLQSLRGSARSCSLNAGWPCRAVCSKCVRERSRSAWGRFIGLPYGNAEGACLGDQETWLSVLKAWLLGVIVESVVSDPVMILSVLLTKASWSFCMCHERSSSRTAPYLHAVPARARI